MRAQRNDCIRLNKAIDLLHVTGSRLMIMHMNDGDHYYVVPGGRLDRSDAQKILARPDVVEFDDGPFPGNPQSWKLAR